MFVSYFHFKRNNYTIRYWEGVRGNGTYMNTFQIYCVQKLSKISFYLACRSSGSLRLEEGLFSGLGSILCVDLNKHLLNPDNLTFFHIFLLCSHGTMLQQHSISTTISCQHSWMPLGWDKALELLSPPAQSSALHFGRSTPSLSAAVYWICK